MALKSWIASANDPATDFPIENLPYGVFRYHHQNHIGVAIGDQILDLHACANQALLAPLPDQIILACRAPLLNPLMSLGPEAWSALRRCITAMLDVDRADGPMQRCIEGLLVPILSRPRLIDRNQRASCSQALRPDKICKPRSRLRASVLTRLRVGDGHLRRPRQSVGATHPHRGSGKACFWLVPCQ